MLNTPKIYKMRVVCGSSSVADTKQFFARLRKMVLSSGLPFEPAKVNKNWPRMAYGPVPGYAQQVREEYADIYLQKRLKAAEVLAALQQAADGLKVLRVTRVPYALPSVPNLAEVYQYSVQGDFEAYQPQHTLEEFLSGKSIVSKQVLENGFTQEIDLKPFIFSWKQEENQKISLYLRKVNDKCAKPEHVIAAWLGVQLAQGTEEFTIKDIKFIREGLFWRDSQGQLRPI